MTPPPPSYAPTVGLVTTWWTDTAAAVWTPERIAAAEAAQARTVEALDRLSQTITETPEERRQRLDREEDARIDADRVAAGKKPETDRERAQRHKQRDRVRRHRAERYASMLHKVDSSERVRRFRRWSVLTGLSASVGYSVGLVQWADAQGIGAYVVLAAGWALDLWMRRDAHGHMTRVSQVRGAVRLPVLVLVRVPVASALAAACHLAPLLAATGRVLHHH
ncbi:hypothetical protein [Kitasatospora aureofaciens]|uniref:hypothetical protein n=1 Tax=Kitasatospora aureofaciens TaxID=1894 RepID=UPI00380C3BCD